MHGSLHGSNRQGSSMTVKDFTATSRIALMETDCCHGSLDDAQTSELLYKLSKPPKPIEMNATTTHCRPVIH